MAHICSPFKHQKNLIGLSDLIFSKAPGTKRDLGGWAIVSHLKSILIPP